MKIEFPNEGVSPCQETMNFPFIDQHSCQTGIDTRDVSSLKDPRDNTKSFFHRFSGLGNI